MGRLLLVEPGPFRKLTGLFAPLLRDLRSGAEWFGLTVTVSEARRLLLQPGPPYAVYEKSQSRDAFVGGLRVDQNA